MARHLTVLVSESPDRGETWSKVHDHPQLFNPGAGLELINLKDGRFLAIYNDTEDGRHQLAVSISEDEGASYRWTRHLEKRPKGKGSFHYPSIIQSEDGMLHATYSYFIPEDSRKKVNPSNMLGSTSSGSPKGLQPVSPEWM